MRKTMQRLVVILVLAGLFLCGVAFEGTDSEKGPTLTVSAVEAPPGDGGCPTCGQILPSIWRGG